MQPKPKPVVRKRNIKSCECCTHKTGDFFMDKIDPNIIRVYCKARHTNVDAEAMSDNCDFWQLNQLYEKKDKVENKYGL